MYAHTVIQWMYMIILYTNYAHTCTHVQIIQKRETAAKPPTHYRSASLTFRADSLSPTSTLERGKKVESGMGLEFDEDIFPVPRMITILGESISSCYTCVCATVDLYINYEHYPIPALLPLFYPMYFALYTWSW